MSTSVEDQVLASANEVLGQCIEDYSYKGFDPNVTRNAAVRAIGVKGISQILIMTHLRGTNRRKLGTLTIDSAGQVTNISDLFANEVLVEDPRGSPLKLSFSRIQAAFARVLYTIIEANEDQFPDRCLTTRIPKKNQFYHRASFAISEDEFVQWWSWLNEWSRHINKQVNQEAVRAQLKQWESSRLADLIR
jgi:hypothetical protein